MKTRALYTMPVWLVLFFSCTAEPVQEDILQPTAQNRVQVEQELFAVVNGHRKALGLNVLQFSEVAYKYANEHTAYMIAKGGLSHDHFSARASGIHSELEVDMVAENVANKYNTADEAFKGWYNSPNHKKTMEGEFTHTAVSVKENDEGQLYFTQLFFRK